MLINKSGRLLVIGRMKIRAGEPVPGITLTSGEKKSVEAFTKVGYLVEVKPEVKPEAKSEAKPETPKTAAPVKPKVQKSPEKPAESK